MRCRLRLRRSARASSYFLSFFLILATGLQADTIPPPSGPVLLVIDGNISRTNANQALHLDLAMLEALPRTSFVTTTPWRAGEFRFDGVRLNELLKFSGASSWSFTATGFDDYQVEFSGVDLDRYPVIVAFLQDGKSMSVRKLGPLRIMFPFATYPQLLNETNKSFAVWQLVRMTVH